jgi:hypothetical protein
LLISSRWYSVPVCPSASTSLYSQLDLLQLGLQVVIVDFHQEGVLPDVPPLNRLSQSVRQLRCTDQRFCRGLRLTADNIVGPQAVRPFPSTTIRPVKDGVDFISGSLFLEPQKK